MGLATNGGECYALDVTGSQHGYDESVIPWEQYLTSRVMKVLKRHEFGETRKQVLSDHKKPESIWRELLVAYKTALLSFFDESLMEWIKKNITLKAMVRLPEDAFLKSRTELLNHLETSMKKAVKLIREQKPPPKVPKVHPTTP